MKRNHVKKRFQGWHDGDIDEGSRSRIRDHLVECGECRLYYERMSQCLDKPDPESLPHLEPDPFLPARISSIAGNSIESSVHRMGFSWVRVSLLGVMTALAMVLGIFLGKGLSTPADDLDDTGLINAYYEAFSQDSFARDLEDIIGGEQEEL